MQGCRQCEQLTSGDCGNHADVFINMTPYGQMPPYRPWESGQRRAARELIDETIANLEKLRRILDEKWNE